MKEVKDIKAAISLLQEQMGRILEKVETEEEAPRAARMPRSSKGPRTTRTSLAEEKPMTLDQILMTSEPLSDAQIVKVMKVSEEEAKELTKALESKDKIVNVGMPKDPRWAWYPGEEASPDELTQHVVRLISGRPMSWHELMSATGARHGRLSGALERARKEFGAINVSPKTPRRAVWFIPKAP